MATAQKKSVEREKVEESGALAVYHAMIERVKEIYEVSLKLENSEELAGLLKAVEVVQVHIAMIVGKLEMEMEIEKNTREYEERVVGVESE